MVLLINENKTKLMVMIRNTTMYSLHQSVYIRASRGLQVLGININDKNYICKWYQDENEYGKEMFSSKLLSKILNKGAL